MMTRKKQAQISSEIFVYVLAIIVIGLIVIFGYKRVTDISKSGNEIENLQFKKELESMIKNGMPAGNVFLEEYKLPPGFSKICFIDITKSAPSQQPDISVLPSMIYDSWNAKVEKNVFLVHQNKIESFYIDKERLEIGTVSGECKGDDVSYQCCETKNGKVELKLSGAGKKTIIGTKTTAIITPACDCDINDDCCSDECNWDNIGVTIDCPDGKFCDASHNCVPIIPQVANNPPNKPVCTSPIGIDIPTTTTLEWSGGDPDAGDTLTYDIYFDENENKVEQETVTKKASTPSTNYQISALQENTEYYWKIVAKDSHGAITKGDVCNFKTGNVAPPPTAIITALLPQTQNIDPLGHITFRWKYEEPFDTSVIQTQRLYVREHKDQCSPNIQFDIEQWKKDTLYLLIQDNQPRYGDNNIVAQGNFCVDIPQNYYYLYKGKNKIVKVENSPSYEYKLDNDYILLDNTEYIWSVSYLDKDGGVIIPEIPPSDVSLWKFKTSLLCNLVAEKTEDLILEFRIVTFPASYYKALPLLTTSVPTFIYYNYKNVNNIESAFLIDKAGNEARLEPFGGMDNCGSAYSIKSYIAHSIYINSGYKIKVKYMDIYGNVKEKIFNLWNNPCKNNEYALPYTPETIINDVCSTPPDMTQKTCQEYCDISQTNYKNNNPGYEVKGFCRNDLTQEFSGDNSYTDILEECLHLNYCIEYNEITDCSGNQICTCYSKQI